MIYWPSNNCTNHKSLTYRVDGLVSQKKIETCLFKYWSCFTFDSLHLSNSTVWSYDLLPIYGVRLKIVGVATTSLPANPFSYLPVGLSVHLHLSIFPSVCTRGPLALVQSPGLRPKGVLSEGRGELTGLTAGLHGYGWGRRQEPKAGPELHSNQCIKGVTDRSRG